MDKNKVDITEYAGGLKDDGMEEIEKEENTTEGGDE